MFYQPSMGIWYVRYWHQAKCQSKTWRGRLKCGYKFVCILENCILATLKNYLLRDKSWILEPGQPDSIPNLSPLSTWSLFWDSWHSILAVVHSHPPAGHGHHGGHHCTGRVDQNGNIYLGKGWKRKPVDEWIDLMEHLSRNAGFNVFSQPNLGANSHQHLQLCLWPQVISAYHAGVENSSWMELRYSWTH